MLLYPRTEPAIHGNRRPEEPSVRYILFSFLRITQKTPIVIRLVIEIGNWKTDRLAL